MDCTIVFLLAIHCILLLPKTYALRRRFAFFNLEPSFQSKGFKKYQKELNNQRFDKLITCVEDLNLEIEADESLGRGFCIGHSYFSDLKSIKEESLERIIEYEVIPLINEYWFDEPSKVSYWADRLRGSIK